MKKTKPKIVFTVKENMSDHTCKYQRDWFFVINILTGWA